MEKTSPHMAKHIFVCGNQRAPEMPKRCCGEDGQKIRAVLKQRVEEMGLKEKIRVSLTGCLSPCEAGPNVMIYPDNVWYKHVSLADVDEIIRQQVEPYLQDDT